ncbi:carotenoid oxygenase family protein [Mycobacterium sp. SMC-16]|nr:carotenoid oxygenase family protein [Mycolicibacterium mucogenicum]MCX8555351.1 carotenoid oxygenase family protein [Mycolicibacterium mucogenicum]
MRTFRTYATARTYPPSTPNTAPRQTNPQVTDLSDRKPADRVRSQELGKAWQDPSDPTDPRAHLTIDEWPRGHLSRFRISKSGRITETVLSATAPMEFPQYDWRRSTLEHNVTYACKATEDVGHYNAVTRIDHRTGDQTTFDFGLAQTGEPLFVPRTAPLPRTTAGCWCSITICGSIVRSW